MCVECWTSSSCVSSARFSCGRFTFRINPLHFALIAPYFFVSQDKRRQHRMKKMNKMGWIKGPETKTTVNNEVWIHVNLSAQNSFCLRIKYECSLHDFTSWSALLLLFALKIICAFIDSVFGFRMGNNTAIGMKITILCKHCNPPVRATLRRLDSLNGVNGVLYGVTFRSISFSARHTQTHNIATNLRNFLRCHLFTHSFPLCLAHIHTLTHTHQRRSGKSLHFGLVSVLVSMTKWRWRHEFCNSIDHFHLKPLPKFRSFWSAAIGYMQAYAWVADANQFGTKQQMAHCAIACASKPRTETVMYFLLPPNSAIVCFHSPLWFYRGHKWREKQWTHFSWAQVNRHHQNAGFIEKFCINTLVWGSSVIARTINQTNLFRFHSPNSPIEWKSAWFLTKFF